MNLRMSITFYHLVVWFFFGASFVVLRVRTSIKERIRVVTTINGIQARLNSFFCVILCVNYFPYVAFTFLALALGEFLT